MNEEVKAAVEYLRQQWKSGVTGDPKGRIAKLRELLATLQVNEEKVLDALNFDLGKCFYEGYLSELAQVYSACRQAIRKLPHWQKPKKLYSLIATGKYEVRHQPYGVVLIMVPFNYPVLLALLPLIAAVAAGNCVLLRFSSETPTVAACLAGIMKKSGLDKQVVVLPGTVENRDTLLNEKYDYIFFTGSQKTGQTVLSKAAKTFTPVTLEMGGKSPCIIDSSINIEVAARRVLFGKLLNAGQTCVAPDYLVIDKKIIEPFITALLKQKKAMIQELEDPTWPPIINEGAYRRLKSYLSDCRIIFGGGYDDEKRKLELTLIIPDTWKHPALHDEIFGPILPLITYESYEELLEIIRVNPDPLALYVFSNNKGFAKKVLNDITYGGACVNDTILQLANNNVPFGGIGKSGMGSYHGIYGFRTFSKPTTILNKRLKGDFQMRFRPYNSNYKKIKKFMKGN